MESDAEENKQLCGTCEELRRACLELRHMVHGQKECYGKWELQGCLERIWEALDKVKCDSDLRQRAIMFGLFAPHYLARILQMGGGVSG